MPAHRQQLPNSRKRFRFGQHLLGIYLHHTLLRAPDTLIWRHDALSPRKGTLLRQFGLRMARRYPVVCRRCLRWSGTFTQIPRKKTALLQPKMGMQGNDTMIRRNNIIFVRHNMPF